jgi:hypothetical protein
MTKATRDETASVNPILADDLSPHIKGRVRSLVQDLNKDDLPMALLDLAQLYRALRPGGIPVAAATQVWGRAEELQTLILGEDGTAVEDDCMGPDAQGKCPLATEGAACAGKWIMNQGWTFRVAPDAPGCPLVSLGLAHRYLRTAVSGEKQVMR